MNINTDHMSPDEVKFIRLYCVLLRREYDKIKTVMALMNPNNTAVRCPIQAAQLADKIECFGRDFDAALEKVKKKHKIKEKRSSLADAKFLHELADIFALSFFKVVAVGGAAPEQVSLVKDGWCSGDPTALSVQTPLSLDDPQASYQKKIISHILSFFSSITSWKNSSTQYKKPETDEEREEYDEDDDWYNDD